MLVLQLIRPASPVIKMKKTATTIPGGGVGLLPEADSESIASTAQTASPFLIGWAQVEITPALPAALGGMKSLRVANEAMDPLMATVLLLDAEYETESNPVVLISCDLRSIRDSLRDKVREILARDLPELDPRRVVLHATHTHNAPPLSKYGLPVDALDDDEYNEMAAPLIVGAVGDAWRNRKPGGVSFGLAHAVIGHNRIMSYNTGKSRMGGAINDENFSHVEGSEDSAVHALYTWSPEGELTGVVINVAVTSQESMSLPRITADFWHDVRLELRSRLGNHLFVLPQCSPAGDQMSRPQIHRRAEDRMQALTGRSRRQQIAVRLADAIESILPCMRENVDWHPILRHRSETVGLPRRMISEQDVKEALASSEMFLESQAEALDDLAKDPSLIEDQDFVKKATRAVWESNRGKRVQERFEAQKLDPTFPVEMHAIRLGDTAIASNPFELYLDFGLQIRARSLPVQVFLVQLAGPGTYIPTERSVRGGAYGAVPASTNVGPDGGRELVNWTVDAINAFWLEPNPDSAKSP